MNPGRRWGVSATALASLALGVVLTVGFVLAARSAHADNERRLIEQRTRQAAAVLEATIPAMEIAPNDSMTVASVAPDDWGTVRETLAGQVGAGGWFISASVWASEHDSAVVAIGETPQLSGHPPVGGTSSAAAGQSASLRVIGLLEGPDPRLGYTVSSSIDQSDDVVVYAEQRLPADRRSMVEQDSAFAGLDHALYLGADPSSRKLIFASTTELPRSPAYEAPRPFPSATQTCC